MPQQNGKNAMLQIAKSTRLFGAVEMFTRSIEKHKLFYYVFVGDGDSSTFGAVVEAVKEKYGNEYIVTKEDCIGHIQKRMGANLRLYKNKKRGVALKDGLGVGGKGRLTDAVIDKMQTYYGCAIRKNLGNRENTKNAVLAIFTT